MLGYYAYRVASVCLQACFQEHQAGRVLTDVLKRWLDHVLNDAEQATQAGAEIWEQQHFVADQLDYLQSTILPPTLGSSGDMHHFGSVCFDTCHLVFDILVKNVEAAEPFPLSHVPKLSAFAVCAGEAMPGGCYCP